MLRPRTESVHQFAAVSSVDDKPPLSRLLILGLQHVLVMYGGDVAVPLLISEALHLPIQDKTLLINSGLFASGLATILQSLGIWKFGARMPVMMGATFVSVSPFIAMGLDPAVGLRGVYGAMLAAGLFGVMIAPLVGRILAIFPPVVIGSLITLLGISLVGIAIDWAAGGAGPNYGDPLGLGLALVVFAIIMLATRFARGFWQSIAVMLGIVAGSLLAVPLGAFRVEGLAKVPWVGFVQPFHFGAPTFHVGAIISMSVVMVITLVESTGVFLALAEITGKKLTPAGLTQALRADGAGVLMGGICNAFPYTTFSQNVGLVTMTRVRSRFVCATGGVILLLLGLIPKMAHVVAAIPKPVLGGAGIVMFGMVAASGIRVLRAVDFDGNPRNLLVVANSIGFGMIPTLAPHFFARLPAWTAPITQSGIVLGALVAVLLNLFLNGI
jgi:NCS2 family nucleobase:cation symporter-2